MTISAEGERLMAFITRIETLNEERQNLATDIREVYNELKSEGYDVKQVKNLVRYRRQDKARLEEEESIFELYKNAIGEA